MIGRAGKAINMLTLRGSGAETPRWGTAYKSLIYCPWVRLGVKVTAGCQLERRARLCRNEMRNYEKQGTDVLARKLVSFIAAHIAFCIARRFLSHPLFQEKYIIIVFKVVVCLPKMSVGSHRI